MINNVLELALTYGQQNLCTGKGPVEKAEGVVRPEAKMFRLWVSLCTGAGLGAEEGRVREKGRVSLGAEGRVRAGRRNKGALLFCGFSACGLG